MYPHPKSFCVESHLAFQLGDKTTLILPVCLSVYMNFVTPFTTLGLASVLSAIELLSYAIIGFNMASFRLT